MGKGSVFCAKMMIISCSTLITLTGLLILAVGLVVQFNYYHYSNFVGESIWTAPMIFIIIGIVVTIFGVMGCCGTFKESPCMMLLFCILLFCVLIVEIVIGIGGYLKHGELHDIVEKQFNTTIVQYNDRPEIKDAWTLLQDELKCCGTYGPKDWHQIMQNDSLPMSCCTFVILSETPKCTIEDANEGCFQKLFTILDSNTLILAGFAIAIAGIQILTICVSCCLRWSFSRNYQVV